MLNATMQQGLLLLGAAAVVLAVLVRSGPTDDEALNATLLAACMGLAVFGALFLVAGGLHALGVV